MSLDPQPTIPQTPEPISEASQSTLQQAPEPMSEAPQPTIPQVPEPVSTPQYPIPQVLLADIAPKANAAPTIMTSGV